MNRRRTPPLQPAPPRRRLRRAVGAALVLAFAGVAALAPAADPAAGTDSCAHGAPRSACLVCDPALRDPGRLWCGEHGSYEDECAVCRGPAAAGGEHAADDGHGHGTGASLFCGEHRLPETQCGICHPELAGGLAVGGELLVRLPTPRSADLAGLRTDRPTAGSGGATVRAHAELAYDRNRLARIPSRVDGIVERVLADVGDRVVAGQPLLEIAAAEVASAKQAFLAARLDARFAQQDLARERSLREQAIAAEREVQAAAAAAARAEAALAAASQHLRNLGLDEAAVADVAATGDTSARLLVRAPFAGEVIAREAVRGEAAVRHQTLLSVADLSRLWLELYVPQEALPLLAAGQAVTADFDALPGRNVTGEVTWIGSELDRRTRLLAARAEVANPDGRLKVGLYGSAEIVTAADAAPQLTVPVAAVQDLESATFVFVRDESDLFALRRVALGPRQGSRVAVLAGLQASDEVVVLGVQTVATELLKSRLGAGCAGD